MKKILFIMIVLGTTCSCIIQFVSGSCYKCLDNDEKKLIHNYDKDFSLVNKNIYEITGPQLLTDLKSQDSSLIYFFKNGCTSKYCLPIKTVVEYAKRKKLKLYLIMRNYFNLKATLREGFKAPLFSINVEYYGGDNNSNKYIRMFNKDIGYKEFLSERQEKWMGNFLFFKGDKLVRIQKSIIKRD